MNNDLVCMELNIEVLERRVELMAAAGGCTSTSTSCSNIVITDVVEALVP